MMSPNTKKSKKYFDCSLRQSGVGVFWYKTILPSLRFHQKDGVPQGRYVIFSSGRLCVGAARG